MEYANADEYSREGRTIFLGREADDAIGLFRGREREGVERNGCKKERYEIK